MKRKEMIIANLIIGTLILGFGFLALRLSLNQNPFKAIHANAQVTNDKQKEEAMGCTNKPQLPIAQNTTDAHLKSLAKYQDICKSFVTNTMMVFTSFAQDSATGEADAGVMAQKLRAFKQVGVTPLIVVEPYVTNQAMSYKTYLSGAYDDGMDTYFKKLKEAGITDDMMGTWVPFPESNTPSWNNKDTEPHDYALCVNKYLGKLKQYFPGAKGSILLNATTYEPDDVNWDNGNYISLSPYVDALDRNLVTSVGIQGFPWMSNAQQRKRTIFDAQEFLQPDLAIGAAQVLRTRDIWINTGTFASKYTNNPTLTVHLSLNERKALLNSILQIATNIRDYQQNQYRVSVNIFSEDKSKANEATDWSYFQNSDSESVLKEFLIKANDAGMPISLYDKEQ